MDNEHIQMQVQLIPLYARVLFSLTVLGIAVMCLNQHQYTNEAFLLIGSVTTYWLSPPRASEIPAAQSREVKISERSTP